MHNLKLITFLITLYSINSFGFDINNMYIIHIVDVFGYGKREDKTIINEVNRNDSTLAYNLLFLTGMSVNCGYKLNDYVSIESGLSFTTRSSSFIHNNNSVELNIYYIDIPVKLSFGYNLTKNFRIFISPGIYVGRSLFCVFDDKHLTKIGGNYGNVYNRYLIPYEFGTSLDVGFVFFNYGIFNVGVDYGLNNIANEDKYLSQAKFESEFMNLSEYSAVAFSRHITFYIGAGGKFDF